MTLTKQQPATAAQPTGTEVRERIASARAEALAAEDRIKQLRREDGRLEGETAALLGDALAADTSPAPEVGALLLRRGQIAAEIESLRARVALLTTSADQAERGLREAEIRDARRAAEVARHRIAELLDWGKQHIRDLRAIQDELREVAASERDAAKDERRLREQVGDTSPVPISEVGAAGPGNVVPNAIAEAMSTGYPTTRDERFETALARLDSVRRAAAATTKQN